MKRTLYCLCLSLVVLLLGCKSATTPSVPVKPSMPSPTNNATGVDHSTVLSWSYPAASTDTTVKYTLYLDTINPPVKNVAGNFTAQSYSAANLANQKTYYWQVNVAKSGTIVTGDVWTFTTN